MLEISRYYNSIWFYDGVEKFVRKKLQVYPNEDKWIIFASIIDKHKNVESKYLGNYIGNPNLHRFFDAPAIAKGISILFLIVWVALAFFIYFK